MSKGLGIKYHLNKVKDVRLKDILSIFPMTAALIASPFFRKKLRSSWAVCERAQEACDNGYHFYKYCRTTHPERSCYYAIDVKSADYKNVEKYGNIVPYGSIRHWLLYFNAEYLISSQSFKPNGYVCTFFERLGIFKPKHVFLQHGITINKADFILASHRPNTVYFITGAKPETDFIENSFGYPPGTVQMTGFARFDALHNYRCKKNRILIMPTWRKWLSLKSEVIENSERDLKSSEYYRKWYELLNSDDFIALVIKYDLEVIFMPHPNMRALLNGSSIINEYIHDANEYPENLQELMKSSKMLITDYSSVFFDMVYMKKPVLFYQFDYEKFRRYHYSEGWFDYRKTSFGSSCSSSDEVIAALDRTLKNDCVVSDDYLEEYKKTFTLCDTSNCKRIYDLIACKNQS